MCNKAWAVGDVRLGWGAPFVLLTVMLLSGCVKTEVSYYASEDIVFVERYNHILYFGSCGSPWNYHDMFHILLQPGRDQCQAPELEIYQTGCKLIIQSGNVSINRADRTVTIDLVLLGHRLSGPFEAGPVQFQYNGTYRYVERELSPGDCTRKSLHDLYKDDKPSLYYYR